MANHFKKNNRKPPRANGARYREKPKSVIGFGNGLKKKANEKPAEKKYSGRRYQPFEWKEGAEKKSVILKFPEESTEPPARHMRKDDEVTEASAAHLNGKAEASAGQLNGDADSTADASPIYRYSDYLEDLSDKAPEDDGAAKEKPENKPLSALPRRYKKSDGKQKILRFQKTNSEKAEIKPSKLFRRKKKEPFDPENLPTSEQLEKELKRERNKKDNNKQDRDEEEDDEGISDIVLYVAIGMGVLLVIVVVLIVVLVASKKKTKKETQ